MDRILISKLPLGCRIGVTDEERATPQTLVLDIELSLDLTSAAASDAIADTVNYALVCDVAEQIASARPFRLIESVAGEIADGILKQFAVEQVRVFVRKPAALAKRGVAYPAIELVRRRNG